MLFKQKGWKHFTRKYDPLLSYSHRVILPGRDAPSRVKVTEFHGVKGEVFDDITYTVDETVLIISGRVRILSGLIEEVTINAGGMYHIPAGDDPYRITMLEDTVAVCFFSQAKNGTLPEDEATPDDGEKGPDLAQQHREGRWR